MRRFAVGLFAIAALAAAPVRLHAQTAASTAIKWSGTPIVRLTLTPNYYSGFGAVKAVFGAQPAPTSGPDATGVGTGAVDFGAVLSGEQYLYKYAAHLNVFTNSPAGFNVYGEGAADFFNQTDSTSQALSQTLFYVNSTSGSPADSNTGFTPGFPFYKSSAGVTGGSFSTAPTITYSTYPVPIASTPNATGDFYYDYELKVPADATTGQYYVWIVYTVVPQ